MVTIMMNANQLSSFLLAVVVVAMISKLQKHEQTFLWKISVITSMIIWINRNLLSTIVPAVCSKPLLSAEVWARILPEVACMGRDTVLRVLQPKH